MIYREAGEFKISYKEDQETFTIKFDKIAFWLSILIIALVVPFFVNDYWVNAIFWM